jgi:hypothetical protein
VSAAPLHTTDCPEAWGQHLGQASLLRQQQVSHNSFGNHSNSLHSSHSVASTASENHSAMSYPSSAKNLASDSGAKISIFEIERQQLAERVAEALEEDFGNAKSSVKEIMRAANCNEASAKNWKQAKCCPDFLNGLRLMMRSPALQKQILTLIGMERDLDPNFQRDLAALLRRMT